jgi:hypothetical protein
VPPPLIDDAPQLLKEFRHAVNLIEDDQLVFVICKVPVGIGKLGAVILVFKIQVDRRLLLDDLQSEGCLSGLARPQKDNGWRVTKEVVKSGTKAASQHVCNYRV